MKKKIDIKDVVPGVFLHVEPHPSNKGGEKFEKDFLECDFIVKEVGRDNSDQGINITIARIDGRSCNNNSGTHWNHRVSYSGGDQFYINTFYKIVNFESRMRIIMRDLNA